jgi:hypothetical protein
LTGGWAFLFALSTAVAAALLASSTGLVEDFIESVFIASVFIASAGAVEVVDGVEGVVLVVGAGAGVVVAGAGAGVVAGAGAGAGVGAGGGGVSFLPHAASATTIIEASNSDLFISSNPLCLVTVSGW